MKLSENPTKSEKKRYRRTVLEKKSNIELEKKLKYKNVPKTKFLVMHDGDQENPVFEEKSFLELIKEDTVHYNRPRTAIKESLSTHCWFSGVRIYLPTKELEKKLQYKLAWAASRDHLVPSRGRSKYFYGDKYEEHLQSDYYKGRHPPNFDFFKGRQKFTRFLQNRIVIVGRLINIMLGHDPLPIKLYCRQQCKNLNIDRENPVLNVAKIIYDFYIKIQKPFLYKGRYIFQPWAYHNSVDRIKSKLFFDKMLDEEDKFMNMSSEEQDDYIDNFDSSILSY